MQQARQRFLVTGGAGFIGARAVRLLTEQGCRVRVLDPSSSLQRIADLIDRVDLASTDIGDEHGLRTAMEGIDAVLHFAAAGIRYGSATSFEELVSTNLTGTWKVISAAGAAGVGKVVCAGSVFEYGYRQERGFQGSLGRETPVRPLNVYGATKAAASMLAAIAGDRANVETTVLRIFSPYGPGEAVERFVPSVILAALKGEPVRMTGGDQIRDLCYVDDVAAAFITEATRRHGEHRQLNLGTGRGLRLRDAVTIILDTIGADAPVELGALPYRPGEAFCLVAAADELDPALRSCLATPFESGCKRTVEWFAGSKLI
jgi:nucleoside-diphosphate-sugar epimerase